MLIIYKHQLEDLQLKTDNPLPQQFQVDCSSVLCSNRYQRHRAKYFIQSFSQKLSRESRCNECQADCIVSDSSPCGGGNDVYRDKSKSGVLILKRLH